VLEAQEVTVSRAGLPIVRGISLNVHAGRISVLLGVNGAGKTTLLEGLSGVIPLDGGALRLAGERIDRWRPVRRARAGLAHVEQGRAVFRDLTTEENLRVAQGGRGPIDEAFDLFPELAKRRHVLASLLSGGEQQMLVVARAWLRRPSVFMLDELSLGLAPAVVTRLLSAVRQLADQGMGILLVEQFAPLALEIGDLAYVLRGGQMVFDGRASELRGAPERVQALYFGDEPAEADT
jgi:branched-chain amino acid transport system ATP-binding protein